MLSPLKILIVDDDALSREILSRLILRLEQCWIVEASDGIEALAKLEEEVPDLVFLDLNIRYMSGIEVVETIRKAQQFASLPVIVTSGTSARETIIHLISLGIADYLVKPFDLADMAERVARVMNEVKRGRQTRDQHFNVIAKGEAKQRLLIVDSDVSFRSMAAHALAGYFEVYSVPSGPKALTCFVDFEPHIVLISDNLMLMSDTTLAERLRYLDASRSLRIFLLASSAVPRRKNSMFTGVIHKTSVAEHLLQEVERVIFNRKSVVADAMILLLAHFHKELFATLTSNMEILLVQEVDVPKAGACNDVSNESRALLRLIEPGRESESDSLPSPTLAVGIWMSEADLTGICSIVQGSSLPSGSDKQLMVEEVLSTVARLATFLLYNSDIHLVLDPKGADREAETFLAAEWRIQTCIETRHSQRFAIAIGLV